MLKNKALKAAKLMVLFLGFAAFFSCVTPPEKKEKGLITGPPVIELLDVPDHGQKGVLTGRIKNLDGGGYNAAVYVYKNGWYNKPFWKPCESEIKNDGSFSCDITTEAGDEFASKIAVFAVKKGIKPRLLAGEKKLPASLYEESAAGREYQRMYIDFSGYKWVVSSSKTLMGPGPNYFSEHPEDIFVDEKGYLHLCISKRGGKWHSSAIVLSESLGYGKYVFYVRGRIDRLDKNTIVGLFTWDNNAPQNKYREIDIEFSRWGMDAYDNTQFVVQPHKEAENIRRFNIEIKETEDTAHVFEWKRESIYFQSAYISAPFKKPSKKDIIYSWKCTSPDIPPKGREKVILNFWLLDGKAPSDGMETEVVITGFEFIPAGKL
ncbi:MAG TPA: hypothetical protein ENN55_04885 [Firmicutes bacterium]|nr:hypothetical protein [Bacillota bacterium]